MATNNLTDEDIQAIASSVYELILQGSANSINYGKAEDEMEVPTTEEERKKYNLGVIYISGETKKAGNMHIQKLFTAFGSDAQTVLNNYVNNTLKPSLDSYVNNTSKEQINEHVEEKTDAFDTHADGKIQEATDAADDALSYKNQAETAKQGALSAQAGAEDAVDEMTALKNQMLTLSGQASAPTVTINGKLYTVSTVVKSGLIYRKYTEVQETDDSTIE